MRARIHETALAYAVAADGRLWVRSCSAKSPFANRDAQRLGSLLQKLLDAAPSPIPSVQMLVNHGDQPVMQKAQLGGGLPVFEPSCAPAYWCVAMPSPFHVARALGVPGSQPPNATAFPWAARTRKAWWRGELAVRADYQRARRVAAAVDRHVARGSEPCDRNTICGCSSSSPLAVAHFAATRRI